MKLILILHVVTSVTCLRSPFKLVVNTTDIQNIVKIFSPKTNHDSSKTNHESSKAYHESSKTYHDSSKANHDTYKSSKHEPDIASTGSKEVFLPAEQNFTKLTFREMVTIYHDIWNTILIGKILKC